MPPILESGQRRRKSASVGETTMGGGGGLERRLGAPLAVMVDEE